MDHMEEKIDKAIDFTNEVLTLLHRMKGELHAAEDFCIIQRGNFKIVPGGKSEKKGKRKKSE